MYNPEKRQKWDKTIKNMKIIEGTYPDRYIIHNVFHSPVFFISEREVVDKKTEFFFNGIYYNLTTSVDEDFIPSDKNYVRIKNFLNVFIITECDEYFHFMSFNQVDPKVFYNLTLFIYLLDENP